MVAAYLNEKTGSMLHQLRCASRRFQALPGASKHFQVLPGTPMHFQALVTASMRFDEAASMDELVVGLSQARNDTS